MNALNASGLSAKSKNEEDGNISGIAILPNEDEQVPTEVLQKSSNTAQQNESSTSQEKMVTPVKCSRGRPRKKRLISSDILDTNTNTNDVTETHQGERVSVNSDIAPDLDDSMITRVKKRSRSRAIFSSNLRMNQSELSEGNSNDYVTVKPTKTKSKNLMDSQNSHVNQDKVIFRFVITPFYFLGILTNY